MRWRCTNSWWTGGVSRVDSNRSMQVVLWKKFIIVNLIDAIATTPKSLVTFAWRGTRQHIVHSQWDSSPEPIPWSHQLMELGIREYRFQKFSFHPIMKCMLWILLYWTADMVEYILELQVYIQLVNYLFLSVLLFIEILSFSTFDG